MFAYITYSWWIFLNIFVFQVPKSRIGWIIETISGKYSDIFKRPWVIVFISFDFFVVNFDDEENLKKNDKSEMFSKRELILIVFYLSIHLGLFNLNFDPLVCFHCSVEVSIAIAIDGVDEVELAIIT